MPKKQKILQANQKGGVYVHGHAFYEEKWAEIAFK